MTPLAVGSGPPRLRLFFALWPDDATRRQLAEWTGALHRAAGGRAMRPERVHLTLAFLGETGAALLPAIERAAASVPPRAFALTLDEPGYWRHNRIAWAGAREVPAALDELVAALRDALAREAVPFDAKPFVPHVTLVRKARVGFALPELPPIHWPVDGFVLVQSVSGPNGADYAVRERWP